jgi:chromosome segregation ATPase
MSDKRLEQELDATKEYLVDLHKRLDIHQESDEKNDARMDRIENKLDTLTNAVVSIARAEEKIMVLIEDTHEMKGAINAHTNRIHNLEIDTTQNKSNLKTLFNLFWTIAGATLTVLVAMGIGFYI